jgi:hypothetical protein
VRRNRLGGERASGAAHILVHPQVADGERRGGDARNVLEVEREVSCIAAAVEKDHCDLAHANGLVQVPGSSMRRVSFSVSDASIRDI